jgi:hypothetical protein
MINPLKYALTAQRWLRKMVAMLRELRTHEQAILATRDVLVRELRHNAYVVRQYEQKQWAMKDVQAQLRLTRWHQLATDWTVLRKRHLDLWHEIADAYDALTKTQGIRAEPPSSVHLDQLAQRLSEAEL